MLHVRQELSWGEPFVVVVELRHIVEILARQRPPAEGDEAGHLPVRGPPAKRVQQSCLARTWCWTVCGTRDSMVTK